MRSLTARLVGWSRPYQEAGYEIIQLRDPRLFEKPVEHVTGVLIAPPCQHLAGSGARWWKGKGTEPLLDALSIVDASLRVVTAVSPEWWALEQPAGRLSRYLGKPVKTFQPFEFGDPWTKRTCLWGSFIMPVKTPVEAIKGTRFWSAAQRKTAADEFISPGFIRAFFRVNR